MGQTACIKMCLPEKATPSSGWHFKQARIHTLNST